MDFKFQRDDLKFWRNQTDDLKNKSAIEEHETISEVEDDYLDIKAGSEELLNFRKVRKESPSALPDLMLEENSAGLDKNTNKKFKAGKMNIDARLDMHGMTQDVAFNSFLSFVKASFDNGHRCVIVVTGKGFFSKNGGILRQSLPIWINNEDVRPKILSFCQARPKDGGGGAYYIFLKKKK